MKANDHDTAESQLAAYALGALDPADRQAVEELLARSPAHHEELRQLREVVAMLPFAAPPADPPERVRTALFARIEASRAGTLPAPARPAPALAAPAPRRAARWAVPAMLAALAALVIALGGLTANLSASVARLNQTNAELVGVMAGLQQSLADTRDRQEALTAELADSRRQLGAVSAQLAAGEQRLNQLSAQLARDEQVIAFVSAPGVATRQLAPADAAAAARGEMYMYPGEASAVVLFSGLAPLDPGQVYQFWLADGATQVAGGTFQVDETGLARIVVEAPREVNAFSEVMVTVEPSGGSPAPSEQVVLAGSL